MAHTHVYSNVTIQLGIARVSGTLRSLQWDLNGTAMPI